MNSNQKLSETLGEPARITERRKALSDVLATLKNSLKVLQRDPDISANTVGDEELENALRVQAMEDRRNHSMNQGGRGMGPPGGPPHRGGGGPPPNRGMPPQDGRGGMPPNMQRGGMPPNMQQRGGMPPHMQQRGGQPPPNMPPGQGQPPQGKTGNLFGGNPLGK